MAAPLKYIGQSAMDLFYKEYKSPTDFFNLQDFIFRAASVIAEIYQKAYDAKYAELRADTRKEELVGFDPSFLAEQEIEIDRKTNIAKLKFPVMSFLSSVASAGFQDLLPLDPKDANLERSSVSDMWLDQYVPTTNRIFWAPLNDKIIFKIFGKCSIRKALLLYVPSMMNKDGQVLGDALVPDGVAETAITATVLKMKQMTSEVVVKEALDGNSNKTLQTEANPMATK